MDIKAKLHLIKTIIIPSLTYQCIPLNTCTPSDFAKLQMVVSRSLRMAYKIRYPDNIATTKSLLERAKLKPINQIIYHRAKNMWNKIEAGTAADMDTVNNLLRIPIDKSHKWFPSSYVRAQQDEPPPIYTSSDISNPEVQAYYKVFQN